MRWFGWGDPAHVSHGLPDGALELLRARVGLSDMPRPPFPLSAIRLPAPVEFDIPGVQLRTDDEARILHAGGKSYPDLVRMRSGALEAAPDAVAVPRTEHEVRAALDAGVAVVPFGGGTSVVGGVDAVRGRHPAVVSLDLGMLDRLLSVDERSRIAVFEPGIQLPAAEAALNAQGFTLGHFPQSYEYATVGGCVATRSAGQASTGYGRIDELVVGLEVIPEYVEEMRQRFAGRQNVRIECLDITSTSFDLAALSFDSAVSFNVFEHIPDDVGAMRHVYHALCPGGRLALLVPAHQALYGHFDELIGHQRRYGKRELSEKLRSAGFHVDRVSYSNPLGALGWLVNLRLLRQRQLKAVRAYDSVVPLLAGAERLVRPPFGLSVVAIAHRPAA